ncbi:helix-turn-helix and ligand-binding sensor domain-containing protein [Winogradskyella immobilis]|uniref:LuxR family transcriptional regulator n=1 Tax=Winogradskyella immobilis TaxID=2816852 RepID=A0ABS8EKQ1_9FLAO|nr:triple tyrosine motif-containing protein [Winogradskyella immobilis]MCC1483803.1 LuxR family transcriptional regulator [Winogradskyella immobilis]MCG0015897.1 LuxR C-terminal-related transcriptional regulator [Winogradskyella immobilis]
MIFNLLTLFFIVVLLYSSIQILPKTVFITYFYNINLIFKFKAIAIGSLFLILPLNVIGQELPPLQNFSPQTYGADDQNWSISQDVNKIIYVANNKGLLEYNGAKWKLYSTPNNSILRSVEVIEDKIYTGSYMDFGFWKRNKYGLLEYKSLSENFEHELIEDEEFWEIIALEDWVLFQSLDRIYIYHTKDFSYRIIDSNTRIVKMYKVDDTIYFQKIGDGIYKIENGNEILVASSQSIINKEIINVFYNDNSLLFQTKEDGFYEYSNQVITEWNITSNQFLKTVSVYNSVKLSNGDFILGTISNGVIHLNAEGEVILKMDQPNGLSNNTVLSVFEDVSGNIWLGLDNGINVLNLNSPFKVYRDSQGVLGTIYTSIKIDEYLYLGTNQGLFYRSLNSNSKFQFVNGTEGQVWDLQIIDGSLLCGHDKGTFIVDKDNANLISEEKGTWVIKKIEENPNLLIQGNYKGISILEKTFNNRWRFRNKLKGFNISSRYFEFLSPSELLVSHEYKGVYKLKINQDFSEVINYKKEDIDKGVSSSLINYNGNLLYAYNDGIFKYNTLDQSFKKDSILSSLYTESNYISGKLVNDTYGNKLWSFSEDQIIYIEPGKLTNEPKINKLFLPSQVRKSKTGYENLVYLEEGVYLMGTTEGYLIIDLNKIEQTNLEIKLNTISYNALHNQMLPLELEEQASLENNNNNIYFNYSIANFNKLSPTLYQYRLLGIYDNWSSWSTNSEILFENLPHGDYTFEARAKIGNQLSNNSAIFLFTIEKPWYLKPLAVALYIIGFVLIVLLVQYINIKYYRSQRAKLLATKEREIEFKELENQRQLMEFKNQNLHQDIESKNRELGISTMNLIKKNEFLNNIKNELKGLEDIKGLKNVIRIIDKNINNTEDWKFFEEAFNNADKDFLKKIKKIHPTLTPNDLKLCAYLRLNLSSKEIAPLLNISSRSVEVKRYRLRKKMDLPHEASLTNYILEI